MVRDLFPGPMERDAEAEAKVFGRYLVGTEPADDLIERYRAATARHCDDAPTRPDAAVLRFAVRHPWSVGPLDAAAALVAPASRLRAHMLLMAAVLETTTEYADSFLPVASGRAGLAFRLVGIGVMAVVRATVGLPLHAVIRARG